MKRTHLTFAAALSMLAAVQLNAGVRVSPVDEGSPPDSSKTAISTPETKKPESPAPASATQGNEQVVSFRVPNGNYVTANPGNALDLGATKIGSKQRFTLIDLNGGDLVDGDEIKIRYTPNVGGAPDRTKSSYWRLADEGVKRSREGDVFKIKRMDARCAFQMSNGKFVGKPLGGLFAVTDKKEDALLLEPVDSSTGTAVPVTANPSATGQPVASASGKPAAEKAAPEKPVADKPVTE